MPHLFLTWAPDGGEWWVSCPGQFMPGERAPIIHWVDGMCLNELSLPRAFIYDLPHYF